MEILSLLSSIKWHWKSVRGVDQKKELLFKWGRELLYGHVAVIKYSSQIITISFRIWLSISLLFSNVLLFYFIFILSRGYYNNAKARRRESLENKNGAIYESFHYSSFHILHKNIHTFSLPKNIRLSKWRCEGKKKQKCFSGFSPCTYIYLSLSLSHTY